MLSLERWNPKAFIYEVSFDHIAFWIQIHGLPLDNLNTKNAVKIGSRIGEVLEVEDPMVEGNLLRNFLRVRVVVNINNPLPTGFWVLRRDLPSPWALQI